MVAVAVTAAADAARNCPRTDGRVPAVLVTALAATVAGRRPPPGRTTAAAATPSLTLPGQGRGGGETRVELTKLWSVPNADLNMVIYISVNKKIMRR